MLVLAFISSGVLEVVGVGLVVLDIGRERNAARRLLEVPPAFLVYDTVTVRTADNRARIDLWDDADRARKSHDSEQFDAEPEERDRFKLVDNAEVTWDASPSTDDDAAITRCLQDS